MAFASEQAVEDFLATIADAKQTFLDPNKSIDTQGRIDGFQHLFHLLKTSIDFYLFNDPLRPSLMPLADEHHKILGDNVDAVYYFTQVRGDQEYVIRGRRFDSCYLAFTVYGGVPDGSMAQRTCININHNDIEFEDDGSFQIKLTANPQGKNEFLLAEDAINMFTREYFFDRSNSKEATLTIENVGSTTCSAPLDDEELAKRVAAMSTFFEQTTWITPLPIDFPINDFLPPFPFSSDQVGWGTVDNTYCFGRFRLDDDQYLKIRFHSPECCYWGIQTWNYLMQSMDYRDYRVGINSGTAEAEPDGSFTIYLSRKPMNESNWINTGPYKEAIIFCRWLLAKELPVQPEVELHTHL